MQKFKTRLVTILKIIKAFCDTQLCYDKLAKYYVFIIAVLIVQFVHALYPFVFTRLPVINEFWDIPEQTLITDDSGQNIYVDNTKFINDNNLFGVSYKFDPRLGDGNVLKLYPGMHVNAKLTPKLQEFIEQSNYRFYYDREAEQLVALTAVSAEDVRKLEGILGGAATAELNRLSEFSTKKYEELFQRKKTLPQLEFIAANYKEWAWQLRGQGILHHHSFIFEPIRDLEYGKPARESFFQYGFGMAYMLLWLCKLCGGVTYSIYIKVIYAFYLLFIPVLLYVSKKILRRWDLVLLVFIAYINNFEVLDFTMACAYDGNNPIRYLFVFPALYSYYQFSRTGQKSSYLLTLIFSELMLFVNVQYGLFTCAALICALFYRLVLGEKAKRKAELLRCLVVVAITATVWYAATPAPDIMSKYFLAGLLSSSVTPLVPQLLLIFVVCYCVILTQKLPYTMKSFAVMLILVVQQMMLFYVFESVIQTVFVFLVLAYCFVVNCLKIKWLNTIRTVLYFVVVLVFMVVYWYPAINAHYNGKAEYYSVLETHKINEFPFKTMDIRTDMELQLFSEAAALIDKYSGSSRIMLVSRYDTVLLPAADKINDLPYSDLKAFMFAGYERDNIVRQIEQKKPEYIFVDSDVEISHAVDVVYEQRTANLLYNATTVSIGGAIWKVKTIESFQNIWRQLRPKYQLLEAGRLISVYRLKNEGAG